MATRIDYHAMGYPTGITARDVTGDGKPDLVASVNGLDTSVFANTSTPGTISFDNAVNFVTDDWPNDIAVADLDGDGKLDISAPNINSNTISILGNTGSDSTPSFAAKPDFTSGDGPTGCTLGDLFGAMQPALQWIV